MLNYSRLLNFMRVLKISLFGILISISANAGSNNSLVYHGRIVAPGGAAIDSGSATFRLQIYGRSAKYWNGSALVLGAERCLLYQETHVKNMTGTSGAFELLIGEGTSPVWPVAASASDKRISRLMVNNPLDTGNYIPAVSCVQGTALYFPFGPDATAPEWVDRELVVTITPPGVAAFTLDPVVIKSQPYAMQAGQIGGFSAQNLFRIDGASINKFSVVQHDYLATSLVPGGGGMRIQGLPAVPVSADEATSKAYVDSTVASAISGAGSGTVTAVTGVAPIQSSGGNTPAISISQASSTIPGYLSAADWTTFNNKLGTGSIFAGDVSGPYNANVINAGVITTGKISDAAVTYAKLQNLSGPSLLGRGAAGAGVASEISIGTGLTLSVGGILSSTNAGTVTSVTGTGVISSSGGAAPAISISQAGAAQSGYLSSTDWNLFNNKISSNSIRGIGSVSFDNSGTGAISVSTASGSVDGILTSSNWTTFNNKLGSISGVGSISTNGNAISVSTAATGTNGILSSTDWNLFNSKVSSSAMRGAGAVSVDNSGATPVISVSFAATGSNGQLSSTDWNIFNNKISSNAIRGIGSISFDNSGNGAISVSTAATGTNGILSSTDWNLFNNKVSSNALRGTGNISIDNSGATPSVQISAGQGYLLGRGNAGGAGIATDISIGGGLSMVGNTLTASGAGLVASVNGSGPIDVTAGSNPVISVSYATASVDGVLSSTNWTTFNNKLGSITGVGSISTNGNAISISTAGAGTNGMLSSTDWNIFNNKISSNGIRGLGSVSFDNSGTGVISVSTASGSVDGILTSTNWTTFNNKLGSISGVGSISTNGNAISISTAATAVNGILSSTDWNLFNSKVSSNALRGTGNISIDNSGATPSVQISAGQGYLLGRGNAGGAGIATDISIGGGLSMVGNTLTASGAGLVASVNGSGPIDVTAGSNPVISISTASASVDGMLTSTNWTTFNNKLGSISGVGSISTNGNAISVSTAATGTNGILSSTDWNLFNSKVSSNALRGAGALSIDNSGASPVISVSTAATGVNGILTSTDWNIFNTKLGSISGVGSISTNGNAISISTAATGTNGILSSTDWNSFNNKIGANNIRGIGSVSFDNSGTGAISVSTAATGVNGILTSTDWNSFNSKVSANSLRGTGNVSIDNSGATPAVQISAGQGYLIGRVNAGGDGVATSISIGGGLAMSAGGVLSASGSGLVASVNGSGPITVTAGSNPVISVSYATAAVDGVLSSTNWTTFNNKLGSISGVGSISTNGNAISISTAATGVNGMLTSTDWNTFNTKLGSITGVGSISTAGNAISISTAATGVNGILSSTDWNLFNNKIGANGIRGTGSISFDNTGTGVISISTAATGVNGMLTSTDWNTFNNKVSSNAMRGAGTVSVNNSGATPVISVSVATTAVDGVLTSTDWNTFNNKVSSKALRGTNAISVDNSGATPAISMSAAATGADGYLTSTDWNTFNNKISAKVFRGVGSISVDNSTANPSVSISTASASVNGMLLSTDWSLFNKINALTGAGSVSIAQGAVPSISISTAATGVNGILSSTDWNLFNNKIGANGIRGTGSISFDNTGTGVISISTAATGVNGMLTSTDWNTFNNKISSKLMRGTGSISVDNTGNGVISISTAATGVDGMLTSTDWNLFNNKVSSKLLRGTGNISIDNSAATPSVQISAGQGYLIGRVNTGGAGVASDISIGSGLAMTAGGVLSATGSSAAWLNGGNTFTGSTSIGNNTNHSLTFLANSVPAMTISQNGNIGIGMDPGSAKLAVGGELYAQDIIEIRRYDNSNESGLQFFSTTTQDSGIRIAAGTNDMRIWSQPMNDIMTFGNSTGRVGIGTTAPNTALDVSGTITSRPGSASAGDTGRLVLNELFASGSNFGAIKVADTLSGDTTFTLPTNGGDPNQVLKTNGNGVLSWTSVVSANSIRGTGAISFDNTGTGVISISTAATGTNGMLTSTDWNTFNNKVSSKLIRGTGSISVDNTGNGVISISTAATGTNGMLTSTDWNTFNNKVSSKLMRGTGSISVDNTGNGVISISTAATGVDGMLTSTDWNTFNNKVSSKLLRGTANISVDNSGATPAISISAGQAYLIGRVNAGGAGTASDISIGSGLAMTAGGVLSATGSATAWVNGGNTFTGSTSLGNNTNHSLGFVVNSAPAMTISQNGYVGIGTTAPTHALDVSGANGRIIMHSSVGSPQLVLNDTSGDRGMLSADTGGFKYDSFSSDHIFRTTGSYTERMRLTNSGNLGIGQPAARASLDVSGAIISTASPDMTSTPTNVDFSKGNVLYVTSNCGSYTLNNMKDGGSYSFIVKGTGVGTCAFTAWSGSGTGSLTVRYPPGHGATTNTKMTLYSFMVVGTDLFVAWVPGY